MSVGFYKPGQGYWVRVLTATLIGVLTLAAGAWVYEQMARVHESLPRTVWTMTLARNDASMATGQKVTLIGATPQGSLAGPELGEATVYSHSSTSAEVRVEHPVLKDPAATDPSMTAAVRPVGATGELIVVKSVRGEPAVPAALLQGGAMALVLLIGAMLAYYFTAMHQRFVDFLIATDGEMKKVNWSTGQNIWSSTGVVIAASLMLALCLFIADSAFNWFFQTIGILVH